MQKKYIREMFIDEDERKKQLIFYSSIIVVLSLVCIFFTYYALKTSRTKYITYRENSDVNYKVYLKDNDFYTTNYLDEGQNYIASLIDYVHSDFHYHITFGDKYHYNYKYKINASVNVTEKNTNKSIFSYDELLVPEKDYIDVLEDESDILETVDIDYHKYNDMIQKFVEVYDLENIESVLSVQLIVNIGGEKVDYNESVVSLDIPLTTKTVGIDIESNIVNDSENVLEYQGRESIVLLLLCLILFCIDVMVIFRFLQFHMNSRSVRDIYDQQLRKILNNYHSYIQKISNEFEFDGYQVLYVNEFTDLLEIRETISEPILMTSDSNNKATFFIVPSSTKILYVYSIRIKDIKRELKEMQNLA